MHQSTGSKFTLDSLMTRVLPSLDVTVPISTEGTKKFKRIRPVTSTTLTAPNTPTALTSSTTTTTTTANITAIPATEIAATASADIGVTTTSLGSKLGSPSHQLKTFKDIENGAIPIQTASSSSTATGTESQTATEAGTGITKSANKKRRRKHRKAAEKVAGKPETIGKARAAGTITGTAIETETGTTIMSSLDTTEDQGGKTRKQRKIEHSPSRQHELRKKKLRRDFDARPELVGISKEEDFSTLLVKHVEETNKKLQRDLEKQSQEMEAAQQKQAEQLLKATLGTASLTTEPEAQRKQQQRQQQEKKGSDQKINPHSPSFVPRKNCNFWLKGHCRSGVNCTFRHDPALRNTASTTTTPTISDIAIAQNYV
ncbi:hypothetical protein BX616_010358 [Lobosporangium transversale]|uniref:C3H1-type domain-containing protein n=1 Tax=Lobosporangium transversale TaxID=64571 RepID=A0A1Y2GKM8_9FUNG|nr:hypothetical protein BCR41DRAFT_422795 [Lobosporangium transversale]KAF9912243.1 hypothetical protein BX616_010358 [Lobosporangium transversale]ORZ13907.1 hypothetical protein BCR41DRAFT_422795 [Lobosporangium transversale]|eukprot:XP_021880691.1 hypothetical protein BCR41DRAFT_422795 [Lobosporangium transversale]